MKLFNTLTKKKEEFKPFEEDIVKMYSCGPTVYNYFHIGNARPFIVFDTLRRYFEYKGFTVNFVQNFTDIDDKMINKANQENKSVKEIAEFFIKEYFIDAQGLGIEKATYHPKATEHIDDIIDMIKRLEEKGYAYKIEDSVYFDTKKFKDYGKLSHQSIEELESGARIEINSNKKSPTDFVLWKGEKPGEPSWDSPWGKGRPGWHIECSAMANRYLGDTIDIHSGGQDLIFPHHENEIAQSEACTGKKFATFWLHNGFINVDNQKMSKSLGNFFTVRDITKKFDYQVIRFFMLSAHYRSPINFSDELLKQAESGLERIKNCLNNLIYIRNSKNDQTISSKEHELKQSLISLKDKFIAAMDDDLNTADAISHIFDMVKEINLSITYVNSRDILDLCSSIIIELMQVLGINVNSNSDDFDKEILELVEERQKARKDRNFKKADEIRDRLKEMGIILEDTPQGVKITRK